MDADPFAPLLQFHDGENHGFHKRREVTDLQFTVPLKQNHVFRKLYARGKSAVGPYFVVYAMRNGTRENRLGITAGTKLGHAVVRNRAKRRLRELYRLHEDALRPGYDVVLVARSRCVTAEFARLERSFLKLCEEVKLCKTASPCPFAQGEAPDAPAAGCLQLQGVEEPGKRDS